MEWGGLGRIVSILLQYLITFLANSVCNLLDAYPKFRARVLDSMAVFVAPTTLERLKALFSRSVVEGEDPRKVYSLPVYLRRDGEVLRVGGIVKLRDKPENCSLKFCIKDILVSYDLQQVDACLVPVTINLGDGQSHKVLLGEELTLDLQLISAISELGTAKTLANEGMHKILQDIANYPIQIQRSVRRHQLCCRLRKDVQKFLAGFCTVQSWSLGTVDWRLDPGILGLEKETDFTLEFHIEKFGGCVTHLDLLLGDKWDVRPIPSNSGYRAVITLELGVDTSSQEVKVRAHAVLCPGELGLKHHREETLRSLKSAELLSLEFLSGELKSTENTLNRQEGSLAGFLGTARSLIWEEFRNLEDLNLSSAECSPQRSLQTVSLDSSLLQPSASTVAASLQDLLVKANLNSKNFYFYSPVGKEKKNRTKKSVRKGGPKTSTPEDEFEEEAKDFTEFETLSLAEAEIEKIESGISATLTTVQTQGTSCGNSGVMESELSRIDRIDENGTMLENPRDLTEDPHDLTEDTHNVTESQEDIMEDLHDPQDLMEDSHDLTEDAHDLTEDTHNLTEYPRSSISSSDLSNERTPIPVKNTVSKSDSLENNTVTKCSFSGGEASHLERENFAKLEGVKSAEDSSSCDIYNILAENSNISDLKSLRETDCDRSTSEDSFCSPGLASLPRSTQLKVVQYINSLPSPAMLNSSLTPDKLEMSTDPDKLERSTNPSLILDKLERSTNPSITTDKQEMLTKPSIIPNKLEMSTNPSITPDQQEMSTHRVETSTQVAKSPLVSDWKRGRITTDDDGNISVCSSRSRASRVSDLGSLAGRFGQGALASFYGAGAPVEQSCPFPDEWLYNTIPEVIENDDDID